MGGRGGRGSGEEEDWELGWEFVRAAWVGCRRQVWMHPQVIAWGGDEDDLIPCRGLRRDDGCHDGWMMD